MDFIDTTESISTHCTSCQQTVTARKDRQGGYYCNQCGEIISTQTSTSATTNSTNTTNSMLSSLLNQTLSQTATLQQQHSPFDEAPVISEEMQQRFQQFMMAMGEAMGNQNGTNQTDGFNPFAGGGTSGGAPPAAKTVVESLERLTLDASNIREVTQRIIVRITKTFNKTGSNDSGETKEIESKNIELVCEPGSFGPSISTALSNLLMVVSDPIEMNTSVPINAKEMKNKIVIVKRGKCSFALKVLRAEQAGAAGVVVLNTMSVWPFTMGDSKQEGNAITIPSVMVRMDHSELLLKKLQKDDRDDKEDNEGNEDKEDKEDNEKWKVTLKEDDDTRSCAVCQCDFEIGEHILRMPCPGFRHAFHSDCILPWLKIRNSCPVCRHELKTDSKAWDLKRATERTRLSPDDLYS